MTISSFCHAELLAHGPLSSAELVARAVAAGLTRARDPMAAVTSAIRYSELQLLDGRWVTPLRLLDGRCLTATTLPSRYTWYDEPDADLGLLGPAVRGLLASRQEPLAAGPGKVVCVRVCGGTAEVSTIPEPAATDVAALAEQVEVLRPTSAYREEHRTALRAVAQLMVDDPTTFRTPLPPLSTWVPALVESARREAEEESMLRAWEQEQCRRVQVVLDECQAFDVALAAERAGVPTHHWITEAIDKAIADQRSGDDGRERVVISLRDRRF
jgi:hypothetical protein